MGRDPEPLPVPGSSRPHSPNFRGEPVRPACGRQDAGRAEHRASPPMGPRCPLPLDRRDGAGPAVLGLEGHVVGENV
jgi:hypothetical protein